MFQKSLLTAFLAAIVAVQGSPINDTEAASVTLSTRAPFGINIGVRGDEVLAWEKGKLRCNEREIAHLGPRGNFCEKEWLLPGRGGGFVFHGCGGGMWVTGPNGYSAGCGDYIEGDDCGIHTFWSCT